VRHPWCLGAGDGAAPRHSRRRYAGFVVSEVTYNVTVSIKPYYTINSPAVDGVMACAFSVTAGACVTRLRYWFEWCHPINTHFRCRVVLDETLFYSLAVFNCTFALYWSMVNAVCHCSIMMMMMWWESSWFLFYMHRRFFAKCAKNDFHISASATFVRDLLTSKLLCQ